MTSKQWQLAHDAAQRYESILVTAILGAFARALVDWAALDTSSVVVDVGCGTGAAARFAAQKMGTSGKVIGTDVNPGMLEVAKSLPEVDGAAIDWRQESAYDLSLADESVDAVLCAQTLQFLDNPTNGLREMHRILKPGASAYVSLWCDIEQSPYFDVLVNAIARHINPDTAAGLGAAFQLSDVNTISDHVHAAAFSDLTTEVAELDLDLPPIAEFVPKHIGATPMGAGYNAASPATQQAILDEMRERLAAYQTETGMRVPFRSHLIQAVR